MRKVLIAATAACFSLMPLSVWAQSLPDKGVLSLKQSNQVAQAGEYGGSPAQVSDQDARDAAKAEAEARAAAKARAEARAAAKARAQADAEAEEADAEEGEDTQRVGGGYLSFLAGFSFSPERWTSIGASAGFVVPSDTWSGGLDSSIMFNMGTGSSSYEWLVVPKVILPFGRRQQVFFGPVYGIFGYNPDGNILGAYVDQNDERATHEFGAMVGGRFFPIRKLYVEVSVRGTGEAGLLSGKELGKGGVFRSGINVGIGWNPFGH